MTKEHEIIKQDELIQQENSIDYVQNLRSSEEWEEVTAYEHMSSSAKSHSLTATTLRGEGMIDRLPLKFYNKDKTECVMVAHFGIKL